MILLVLYRFGGPLNQLYLLMDLDYFVLVSIYYKLYTVTANTRGTVPWARKGKPQAPRKRRRTSVASKSVTNTKLMFRKLV